MPDRPVRRPTSVTLPEAPLRETTSLGLNVSRAAEEGLRAEQARRWQAENREAMESWNALYDAGGLSFAVRRKL